MMRALIAGFLLVLSSVAFAESQQVHLFVYSDCNIAGDPIQRVASPLVMEGGSIEGMPFLWECWEENGQQPDRYVRAYAHNHPETGEPLARLRVYDSTASYSLVDWTDINGSCLPSTESVPCASSSIMQVRWYKPGAVQYLEILGK